MSAGTLTLTNNSTAVTGSGTAFTADLKPNDFLVAVVGGVTYTLGVQSITNNTSLVLTTAYNGPTGGGNAWTALPNAALVGITAQVAADVARAIRGLNLDKANWQQVYSGTGNITVTLPDGSTFNGPAWNSITTSLSLKANKGDNSDITALTGLTTALSRQQGGTGLSDPFGNAANTFTEGIDPRLVNNVAVNTNNQDELLGLMGPGNMVKAFRNNGNIAAPWDIPDSSPSIFIRTGDTFAAMSFSYASSKLKVFTGYQSFGWAQTYEIWHTRNTTVDGNGFIKKASPIARLSSNPSEMQPDFLNDFALAGVVAVNEEAKGVSGQRISEGVYVIKGALGLAKEGWTIEVPQDVNGNRLIFVETKVADNGDITVSTFKRVFDVGTATVVAGAPMDIPVGRWIDLRLQMV